MTKFSFEVPIKHLRDFQDLQDYHFTLSILYKNLDYWRYIQQVADEGLSTLWLDNSFNETFQADEVKSLVNLYTRFPFTRVVCPDDFNWTKEQQSRAFLELIESMSESKVLLPVANMEMCYYLELQGVQHFAVSYWVRGKNFTYEELNQIPNIHFLGLLTIDELTAIEPISCDTSMPVKIAMQGKTLDEWISEGCPHINTKDLGFQGSSFFDATLDDWTVDLARRNIKQLKGLTDR